jgi:hypothetical protein
LVARQFALLSNEREREFEGPLRGHERAYRTQWETLVVKPNEHQLATLKVLVEQCQRDLDTLGTELRLRQQGVITRNKDDLVRVEKNIGELTHRIREFINMLE